LLLTQSVAPNLEQPLIAFLIAGLVGLFLFRLCVMALTSFSGAVLVGYSGLCLLNHYGAMDAIAWTEQAGFC